MATATKTRFKELKLATITPDPEQPRKAFDDEGIDELARSMAAEGLLQPITVKLAPTYKAHAPAYILISGERRFRAATQLGWAAIPAMVKDGIGEAEAARLQLLENIVRKDLNPVEEAWGIQKMLDAGATRCEVAATLGWSEQQITWRVEMLRARSDILFLTQTGQMKPSVAHALSALDFFEQGRVLHVIQQEKFTNWNDVIGLCEKVKTGQAQVEMFPDMEVLTQEAKDIAEKFTQGFDQIGKTLMAIAKMEEEHPGSFSTALGPKAEVVEAQIQESIRSLGRVRAMLKSGAAGNLIA